VSYGTSPAGDIRNTVGAGDALLAGYLAGGAKGAAALCNALAWARAAVRSTDTVGPACTDEDCAAVTMASTVPLDLSIHHTERPNLQPSDRQTRKRLTTVNNLRETQT
jgi:1-phosphofructokinase